MDPKTSTTPELLAHAGNLIARANADMRKTIRTTLEDAPDARVIAALRGAIREVTRQLQDADEEGRYDEALPSHLITMETIMDEVRARGLDH